MNFIKETFLSLTPPEKKIKRTPIAGYVGLYCEQNQTGFTFQYSYKSPITGKYRFLKLSRFKYGDNINKKMLDNIVNQLVINQSQVIKGVDPLQKKKTATQATSSGMSVNKVFDKFTDTHHFKQLSESTRQQYLGIYNNHISQRLGKVSVANIRRPDVLAFLNDIELDSIFNEVKKSFQAIQSQAMDLGLIESPFMYGIKRRQTRTSTSSLNDEEIIALMTSTAGWGSLRNICKVQLLTGCRNGEVAGMEWDEIDLKAKTWTIPPERIKTEKAYKKMDRPHVLPLMPKMSEILLQQRQHGTKGLVFPIMRTFKVASPYYQPNAPSRWLKNELGINGGTHQLRRSLASSMADMKNISEFDIKIMLNHAVSGNTKAYINTQYMERKLELYTRWHNHIESLLNAGVQAHG